jgi:hypothetical protein
MVAFAQNWQAIAHEMAKEAFEQHFPSRRGVWYLEEFGILCFYDNNPYAGCPRLREHQTAAFRLLIQKAGIDELAYATYPPAGEKDAAYTFALLLNAGETHMPLVVHMVEVVVRKFFQLAYPERFGGMG